MAVLEALTEEECYLLAILEDESGLDLAEFTWYDHTRKEDGCWRAWEFQIPWFRCKDKFQIDQCGRAVGKSQSIAVRAFAFPFVHPQEEMVITAPERVHLDAITDKVETQLLNTRIAREMLTGGGGRNSIKHQPFHVNFANGSRIMGRIPQRDGRGVKGCITADTLILTRDNGLVPASEIRAGDHVLTHNGRWKPVKIVREDINDCYDVAGQGSFPIRVSCDHRFMGASNLADSKHKRDFSEGLYFEDVEFLLEDNFYWATPTHIPSTHDDLVSDEPSFWWLAGRWVADGYRSMDKKNNKGRRVHWLVHPKDQSEVTSALDDCGLNYRIVKREHSTADNVEVASSFLYDHLAAEFGEHADRKKIPTSLLGIPDKFRESFLNGYLAGDGHWNANRRRWEIGTASKTLAVGLQLLAQTLGYKVNCSFVDPKVSVINGVPLKNKPMRSWRLQLTETGVQVPIGDYLVGKIKSVTPVGKQKIYNIIVEDDHSYLTGTIISHNMHPIWLEMDEAQDYPKAGWDELIETLNTGFEGAVWRAHGVTRGVRDEFYKHSQPDSGWTVHRMTAMHKPFPHWSDEIRQDKLEQYGSKDDPNYRRNILGLHGDATNPLFVLHRLMQCVDQEDGSDYNLFTYQYLRLSDESLKDKGLSIRDALDFNLAHKHGYINYWAGMDIGFTNHPSEILVFGEKKGKKEESTVLELLTRIHLERISEPDQVEAIARVVEFYRPKTFALDSTGVGLPLFQHIQHAYPEMLPFLKGYNFSSKILVDFDASMPVDEWTGDPSKEAQIEKNVLEYAQDSLRGLVDVRRILLPWDRELIGQFQGGTYTTRPGHDQYGRRKIFSSGDDHALDAARMAALGFTQWHIEQLMMVDQQAEVLDVFMQPW